MKLPIPKIRGVRMQMKYVEQPNIAESFVHSDQKPEQKTPEPVPEVAEEQALLKEEV